MSKPASRPRKSRSRAQKVQTRSPGFQGWNTTDDEERERRRWRGLTDIAKVDTLEPDYPYFGSFTVRSTSGGSYVVEIRSLASPENSCGCPDWQVNGLGTCKHIEGVLEKLRRKGKRAFNAAKRAGSSRIEIFPAADGSCAVHVRCPRERTDAAAIAARYCTADGALTGDVLAALPALCNDLRGSGSGPVRVSRHLERRLEEERRRRRRVDDRDRFLTEVEAGEASIDVLRHPLLPYQIDGMLHLAFAERALLADEMGLGKTVQAIAACELLRRRHGVKRALVVLPASLKAEWEDQIARFTELSVTVVSGPRPQRLRLYAADTFFILVNYEQVLIDRDDINRLVGADITILDEAQRIKNWQTKTAKAVKALRSRFAFVLTGTPLENRIDEVYSIIQYLDPRLLGPLFRFNRDFYVLDERGRPSDYKNLAELHTRLAPVMLRRRKDEVEEQLPGRTTDTYYVAMTEEQRLRYADYEAPAARLIAQAQRRPLRKEEFDRLQQLLACMRMICDTPYILDPTCRVSPKLDELEAVLAELLSESGRKIIIFSEWERMLELVRDLAGEIGVDFAWHTGSVPQDKRRVEIRRFKSDPACRLFLSTDSGSVGLNLQVASAVVNMDLPWNPARLEQRIARAWRKYQARKVTIVNLVCEDSIEHRIQHLLAQKQGLADGVLDGRGDIASLRMPSGRVAMVERMATLLRPPETAPSSPAQDPGRRIADEIVDRLGAGVLLIQRYRRDQSGDTIVVVVDDFPPVSTDERVRLAAAVEQTGIVAVEVLDRSAWAAVRRLASTGVVHLDAAGELLHRSDRLAELSEETHQAGRVRNRRVAREWVEQAERKLRMAVLLADGGFPDEAVPALNDVAALAIRSLAIVVDPRLDPSTAEQTPESTLIELAGVRTQVPPGTIAHVAIPGDVANLDARKDAVQDLLAVARTASADGVPTCP